MFPTIPTVAAGRVLTAVQANTTATRTFPNLSGLTKNSGDLLIAVVVGYQSNATANAVWSGWTAGWAEFLDYSTTTGMCIGAAYKWSTGSETGTIAATQAATITGHAAMLLLSIPGAHATTPPEGGGGAQGTAAAANPAAFNPAGWDAEDTLWISVAGSGETATTGAFDAPTTPPTNYVNAAVTALSGDVAGGVYGAVAFRQINAASEDVGTWTLDLSNARNAAAVIAVRPVPAAAAVPTDVRVSFPTPTTDLSGSQEFRALVRRKEASAPAVDPTVALELWESGAKIADVVTGVAVTSTAGQVVSGTWAASALSAVSGANVEAKVASAGSSGGTVEVGAIEWNLTRVPAPSHPVAAPAVRRYHHLLVR